jgi:hypothetical protein
MKMPKWVEKYETHMLLVQAYCELMMAKKNDKHIDTIPIRQRL